MYVCVYIYMYICAQISQSLIQMCLPCPNFSVVSLSLSICFPCCSHSLSLSFFYISLYIKPYIYIYPSFSLSLSLVLSRVNSVLLRTLLFVQRRRAECLGRQSCQFGLCVERPCCSYCRGPIEERIITWYLPVPGDSLSPLYVSLFRRSSVILTQYVLLIFFLFLHGSMSTLAAYSYPQDHSLLLEIKLPLTYRQKKLIGKYQTVCKLEGKDKWVYKGILNIGDCIDFKETCIGMPREQAHLRKFPPPPPKRQKSGLFSASALTMHPGLRSYTPHTKYKLLRTPKHTPKYAPSPLPKPNAEELRRYTKLSDFRCVSVIVSVFGFWRGFAAYLWGVCVCVFFSARRGSVFCTGGV